MSLFAIADLHLSLGTDKPMDVFHGWSDYVERLKTNWERLVTDDDTVVIAGDISWAMKLEECDADFGFINSLPGAKILLKGNHDYWWQTKKKIDDYLLAKGFDTIKVLFNNAYEADGRAICGTRGWYYDKEGDHDMKVINREILQELGITDCWYGHLHGERTHRNAVTGMYKGIDFHLIACDYTGFTPILVR